VGSPPNRQRLYAKKLDEPFHVVLVEPEIPPNTGNVARLCAATGSVLHLVGKLGFRTDEQAVRRAGLDYWHLVRVEYASALGDVEAKLGQRSGGGGKPRLWLFSGRGERSYLDVRYEPGDALVFGKESSGLPDELLESYAAGVVGIPMPGAVRSLNLANAVAIALFEALRQAGALSNPRRRETGSGDEQTET
jgi:tRNA (cytidine/uridine-2'-O-)-methyltransferase